MILDKYREDGYTTARVLPRLEKKSEQEYRLSYVAQEQPKVFLTDVDISGTKVFAEVDLKRLMLSAEVDCFNWINSSGIFQEERVKSGPGLVDSEIPTARLYQGLHRQTRCDALSQPRIQPCRTIPKPY